MALRDRFMAYHVLILLSLIFMAFPMKPSASDVNRVYSEALADLKEAIVKGLGLQSEDFAVTGFDPRDGLVGHSLAYEIDVEVADKVLPLKLLEDVNRWERVDHPIFRTDVREPGLVTSGGSGTSFPVLPPFQLAGPMEIWIQDAQDMRIALPHDIDAGVLKKVILADGAVVTVRGARSISLRHPIDLPLPLNRTQTSIASGLSALAKHLRQASTLPGSLPLSLRIVGPTSLTSPSPPETSSSNTLKLKRLGPGLVELSSPHHPGTTLTPKTLVPMWPLASLNASNSNLISFEKLLASVVGSNGEKGSFRISKADVSAHTFVKIGFGVTKKVKEGDEESGRFHEWMTKPERIRMQFEVLGKVDGKKIVPERVVQIDSLAVENSVARNDLLGNVTMSTIPLILPPLSPFSL